MATCDRLAQELERAAGRGDIPEARSAVQDAWDHGCIDRGTRELLEGKIDGLELNFNEGTVNAIETIIEQQWGDADPGMAGEDEVPAERMRRDVLEQIDEPDADCRAALREGLDRETCTDLTSGLFQWVTCRANEVLDESGASRSLAFERAWAEAAENCVEHDVRLSEEAFDVERGR